METKLILIRHGITDWNKQKKYCGFKNIGLNREGKIQALRLRKQLKSVKCDRVYSSDRRRAIQTARIIFRNPVITKVKKLRELNFGVLEGLSYKEIMKKYPIAYKKWLADPNKNNIPKGESMCSFKKRVSIAFKKIVRINPDKTIAVVCHGGTISIFITKILKSRGFWRYIPRPASISLVEYKKNKPTIKSFNNTTHLR